VAQHLKSERGFGNYEIAISEEEQIFTYDLDENGGIINFEKLEDAQAKRGSVPEPEAALEPEEVPENEEEEHGQTETPEG
jgi:hypothetical protein